MPKKAKKAEEFIFLYNKKVKIPTLVESFTSIPAEEIVKYLLNKEIYLPYYVHKALIRKNIAPVISKAESTEKFSDEMKFRLKWFDKFTVFQLEQLAFGYQLKIDVTEYKKDFWDIIVRNRTELGINNLEFVKLQNLTMKYAKEAQEDYETMKNHFKVIYFEPVGYFDGTKVEDAVEVLTNSTTLNEVRELGQLYNVDIPRRINKKQLIDIVALKLNFEQEKIDEISKKSILEIERYAKRRKVNVSIELKKTDMIEYILIKMPKEDAPKYTNSLKIFAGMNVEEYLYGLKYDEIAGKLIEDRKKLMNKILMIAGIVVVIGVVAYIAFTTI